ncbi:DnaB helicase-like protein [Streptomyces sp. 3211.6]|uniref:DnaB-like helicase C-terminal domain-containing protein n=1 Tax=Streptomyces sp. 3211.6 TaxID=1938845 RepID=UPI000EB0859B|nr:DnaB-like helicase C-terminal domain-containing protein [Streptomyces sp. 3211.6]RKT08148.1 DnaB helicase-like protein [Streptomyces sp. 3211.6]
MTAKPHHNTTHQQKIARALHKTIGCGYQEALRRVRLAAERGLLPSSLDAAGRERAVRILAATETAAILPQTQASPAVFGTHTHPQPADGSRTPSLPWRGTGDLVHLEPGSITVLVSLPTAGRTTMALNIAAHNAERGVTCLFTSGETSDEGLWRKVLNAKYGFDVRRQAPPEGWDAFKAKVNADMSSLPLFIHNPHPGDAVRAVFREGRTMANARGRRLDLWVLDTIQHFSQFTDDGLDLADSMHQARRIAQENQIPVVVTARVLTESKDEAISAEHLPPELRGADSILALHRDNSSWFARREDDSAASTLTVLRPRPSQAGSAQLFLEEERCRFVSLHAGPFTP